MKHYFILSISFAISLQSIAQTLTSIYDIQFKDDASLLAEDDLSNYDGETVTVQGLVTFDPCTYALSTSGSRMGTYIVQADATGDWTGLHVLIDPSASGFGGTLEELNTATLFVDNFQVGNIVECTGIVSTFDGNTQLLLIDEPSVVIDFGTPPIALVRLISDYSLSDGAGGQILQTLSGEPTEGLYIELQNVFVVDVIYNAATLRWTWNLQDIDGNKIQVRDVSGFFRNDLVTDDECNIWAGGASGESETPEEFTAPTEGTYLGYVKGIINESFTSTAYTIAPLVLSDIGPALASPPSITNITRNPAVATSIENVTVSATIIDLDGTVSSANLFYSYGFGSTSYTSTSMAVTGDVWSGIIPGPGIDGEYINYYIESTDNEGNVITSPAIETPKTYIVLDGGITEIAQLQYTPFTNGNSLFTNDSIISDMDITAIVTASKQIYDLNLLTVQDAEDPWSGVFILPAPGDGTENLVRGDEIHIYGGKIIENFGQTSISNMTYTKTADKKPLPGFKTDLNPEEIDAKVFLVAEAYEGMLLRFDDVYQTMDNADPTATDPVYGFGEWRLNTSYTADLGLRVDDNSYSVYFEFGVDSLNEGDIIDYVQGVLSYSFGNYKLEPRDLNDISGFSTIYPNSITSFNFSSLGVNGTINEAEASIALVVPTGTDLSAITPSITYTGQYVEPDPTLEQNFSGPVIYTCYSPVTYTGKQYTVNVSIGDAIQNFEFEDQFEAVPNPATDKFSVIFESNGVENLTFELQDISGNKLMKFNYLANNGKNILPFDLREIVNGLYLLQIRSDDKMTFLKILVSN